MNTYLFKVQLADKKEISREIECQENTNLYDLAKITVEAFNFEFDHCFGFFNKLGDWNYVESEKKYELFTDLIEEGEDLEPTDAKSVKKTSINKVWREINDKMLFLFDYGDCWRFIITLKRIEMGSNSKKKHPIITNAKGKAPKQYEQF